jgi:hypothetical protein
LAALGVLTVIANQLRAGACQLGHLLGCGVSVGGVRIGHRLHDNRRARSEFDNFFGGSTNFHRVAFSDVVLHVDPKKFNRDGSYHNNLLNLMGARQYRVIAPLESANYWGASLQNDV